jgi:hypothetical protein
MNVEYIYKFISFKKGGKGGRKTERLFYQRFLMDIDVP